MTQLPSLSSPPAHSPAPPPGGRHPAHEGRTGRCALSGRRGQSQRSCNNCAQCHTGALALAGVRMAKHYAVAWNTGCQLPRKHR